MALVVPEWLPLVPFPHIKEQCVLIVSTSPQKGTLPSLAASKAFSHLSPAGLHVPLPSIPMTQDLQLSPASTPTQPASLPPMQNPCLFPQPTLLHPQAHSIKNFHIACNSPLPFTAAAASLPSVWIFCREELHGRSAGILSPSSGIRCTCRPGLCGMQA